MVVDDSLDTFPTYGELTQTHGWSNTLPPVGTSITIDAETSSTRYTEQSVLGTGGMGRVVLARDARVGRDVALKILHPQHEVAASERARFLREAQVQGQLEHPSIVPVYDIDRRADGTTFFTMRRVLGRTLQAILEDLRSDNADAKARYTQRELLQAFATVCLTVDYAHSRHVIHRDLKPANIMLGDFGEVYVLDWGLARMVDPASSISEVPRISIPGAMMGTPLYMAPEQMVDPDVGVEADVFSLGLILFEILTLERCRNGRELYAPIDARPSYRFPHLEIAPELEAICVKATSPLIPDRFHSPRAIQEAIVRYLEGDRDRAQRRTLAAKHAERAREALQKTDEPEAMQHLLRAFALEPDNRTHVAMLAEIIGTPPRTRPPDIAQQLADGSRGLIRAGMRYSAYSMGAWFLFIPLLAWMGIKRIDYVLAVALPIGFTAIAARVGMQRLSTSRILQVVMMVTMMSGTMMLSRLFGPFILMSTLMCSWAIVVQAHPDPLMRKIGLAISCLAIVGPLFLELAGVLPASYVFFDGHIEIVSQMADFPRGPTLTLLALATVAIATIPAVFVARIRSELSLSKERELMQDWKLRRLRDDLLRPT